MADEVKIGKVTHYFGKIQVVAIEVTEGELSVGETIRIKGHTSDFTHTIESMQIDRVDVSKVEKGQAVGIRIPEPARVGDEVFKVTG